MSGASGQNHAPDTLGSVVPCIGGIRTRHVPAAGMAPCADFVEGLGSLDGGTSPLSLRYVTFLQHRLLHEYVRENPDPDVLMVEETVVALFAEVCDHAFRMARPGVFPSTERAEHIEIWLNTFASQSFHRRLSAPLRRCTSALRDTLARVGTLNSLPMNPAVTPAERHEQERVNGRAGLELCKARLTSTKGAPMQISCQVL